MKRRPGVLMLFCALTAAAGCATVDSRIAQDLRHRLIGSKEIGYGVGQGSEVKVLGKIADTDEIHRTVGLLRFGSESELSSPEPFPRFMFFMSGDGTMVTLRFGGARVRYQNKEYLMSEETRRSLDRFYH